MGEVNKVVVPAEPTGQLPPQAESPKTDPKPAPSATTHPAPPPKPAEPQKLEIPAKAETLDLSVYETEFAKDGKLSDKSYEALAAKGITKQQVDAYIAGQQAVVQSFHNELFASVGGQDNYWQIAQWAQVNLSEQERGAYNQTMAGSDANAIRLAVKGLAARYEAAYGSDPKLLGGRAAPAGPAPFRSTAELTAAMSDPRYSKDPAFRQDVVDRLKASNIL